MKTFGTDGTLHSVLGVKDLEPVTVGTRITLFDETIGDTCMKDLLQLCGGGKLVCVGVNNLISKIVGSHMSERNQKMLSTLHRD